MAKRRVLNILVIAINVQQKGNPKPGRCCSLFEEEQERHSRTLQAVKISLKTFENASITDGRNALGPFSAFHKVEVNYLMRKRCQLINVDVE